MRPEIDALFAFYPICQQCREQGVFRIYRHCGKYVLRGRTVPAAIYPISALIQGRKSGDRQETTYVRLAGRVDTIGTISPRWQCALKGVFSQGVVLQWVAESV